jgi:hypothetical protein
MPAKDRTWIQNPEKSGTTEYFPEKLPALEDGPESEEETIPRRAVEGLARPDSQESLPDSEFDLNCRCGATGDGNIVYHQDDGEVVQCDECREWSHVGCQRDGRASDLPKKKTFLCDTCDPSIIKETLSGRRSSTSSKR